MFMQPNGKIILFNPNSGNNLYRINEDGSLDINFGTNGIFGLNFIYQSINHTGTIQNISSINNKLYLSLYINDLNSFGVCKLNYDGTFDNSFGTNGIVINRFNYYSTNDTESAEDLIIQSDNKIVIACYLSNSIYSSSLVTTGAIRLNIDGSIDTSFGINGKTVIHSNDIQVIQKNNTYRKW